MHADWVAPNETEFTAIFGGSAIGPDGDERIRSASDRSGNRLVVTLGEQGAALAIPGEPIRRIAAPRVKAVDTTGAGDSFQTNAMVDNVLVAYGASCDVRAAMYANGRDLKDPLLSPVYGDMAGFPPTILTSGTRDLLLSNTVRVHRKLRQAGVEALLFVHEGQAHGGWYRDYTAPESKETFEEIARFFDKHLGK